MADKKLFEQPLKSTFGSTDRIAVGIPGQDGCDNILMDDFVNQLRNEGVSGGTFTNANLVSGVLTINHEKDTNYVELTVYDASGRKVDINGLMQITDVDNIEVDFGGDISAGVWTYILKYWYL
jgi:hypothetical protein